MTQYEKIKARYERLTRCLAGTENLREGEAWNIENVPDYLKGLTEGLGVYLDRVEPTTEPEPTDLNHTTVRVDWALLCAIDELLMSDQAFGCFPAAYNARKEWLGLWEGNKVCTSLRALTGDDYEVRKEGAKAYYENLKG